jgi:hypothetical protein
MNSSEEEPEDGNSGKGSDKPRKWLIVVNFYYLFFFYF